MKVSIITSCYNREKTIRGAVESVLAQDYPDIEYIIVDGASKDQSAKIIREAIAGHEDKVKFISEPDHGMYEAINKGIRMATGEVIALCHSDDFIYAKNTVSHIVERMTATNCDFLYADGVFVDPKDIKKTIRRWIGGKYSRWKVRHGWLPLHPTCYIKSELLNKLGLYDEQYKIAADSDLLVRYLIRDDVRVEYLNEFVTRMRMGGMSTDAKKRKMMWKEDINVYKCHGFKYPTLKKIEKMMWKVPQFVMAKLKGES